MKFQLASIVYVTLLIGVQACGEDGNTSSRWGSSGAGGTGAGGTAGNTQDSGTLDGSTGNFCDTDPLHTGLVAPQTGISADAFDCEILKWTANYKEPDSMIFKAIIYVESRFDKTAASCPNLPCGTPTGWSAQESGCYGLMQIVPACGGNLMAGVILPTGHPNMTTDASLTSWAGSVFNADMNIEIGIGGVADNRAQVQKQFSGCTVEQYTMMAIGNYSSYGSTKSCTVYNTEYCNLVLDAYHTYATAAGYAAHSY